MNLSQLTITAAGYITGGTVKSISGKIYGQNSSINKCNKNCFKNKKALQKE